MPLAEVLHVQVQVPRLLMCDLIQQVNMLQVMFTVKNNCQTTTSQSIEAKLNRVENNPSANQSLNLGLRLQCSGRCDDCE